MSRSRHYTLAVGVLTGTVALGAVPAASATPARVSAGTSPQVVALNHTTNTLYVSNAEGVAVIGVGARAAAATIPFASGPLGIAVNERTNTVYVVDPERSGVAVIDGSTCNARRTTGCAQAPPRVTVGGFPLGVAVNQVTNTAYVGIVDQARLAVIDGTACNRAVHLGCSRPAATVAVGAGPAFPTVDEATNTIYTPLAGDDGNGESMAVIDARACSAVSTAGCGQTPAVAKVGVGANVALMDPATRTLYVTNFVDGTVSVVDAAACNGRVHAGCARTSPTTPAGNGPGLGLALDPSSRTVYVANSNADTVVAIDAARCSARDESGCGRRWPTLQAGEAPQGVALDPRSGTLYVANALNNDLSLLDASACNARRTDGCRDEVPSIITGGARDLAIDPAAHTLYVTQPGSNSLALVDTFACNGWNTFGCRRAPATAPLADAPIGIVEDHSTRTLYVNNSDAGTVSVLDPRRCNAANATGCAPVAPPIGVGGFNAELTVNEQTHTVYAVSEDLNRVSVIDARACTAQVHSGCAQTPATITVGEGPRRVLVDPTTNTIYVSIFGAGSGHTVDVIDATACRAGLTTGCHPVATITVGRAPQGMVIDAATHTLFVANQAFADEPGTVSVIDTRTCNGTVTSGCALTPPRISTALSPRALALDPARHIVYTANTADSTSSFFSSAVCNAAHPAGCAIPAERVATGNAPTDILFDNQTRTVYIAAAFVSPPVPSPLGIVSLYAAR